MNLATLDLPGSAGTRKIASWMTMLLAALVLAACAGSQAPQRPAPEADEVVGPTPNESRRRPHEPHRDG